MNKLCCVCSRIIIKINIPSVIIRWEANRWNECVFTKWLFANLNKKQRQRLPLLVIEQTDIIFSIFFLSVYPVFCEVHETVTLFFFYYLFARLWSWGNHSFCLFVFFPLCLSPRLWSAWGSHIRLFSVVSSFVREVADPCAEASTLRAEEAQGQTCSVT